jgi:hypothetical protein
MNRRKFCLSGAGAAVSVAAAGVASLSANQKSTAVAPTPKVPLYAFVHDRRFLAGRRFAAAALHAGAAARVIALDADPTALWMRDLHPRWSAGGGLIAGLTTARTLFCLEELAHDHWMRVVIRAEHDTSEGHEIVHRLTAAEPSMARMSMALAAQDWPTEMPAALSACAGAMGTQCRMGVAGSTSGVRWSQPHEQLVSFVIA